mgnify:CR=1 FL=1
MKFQYQRWTTSIIVLLALLLPSTGVSYADVDSPRIYEVTITNSTSVSPRSTERRIPSQPLRPKAYSPAKRRPSFGVWFVSSARRRPPIPAMWTKQ